MRFAEREVVRWRAAVPAEWGETTFEIVAPTGHGGILDRGAVSRCPSRSAHVSRATFQPHETPPWPLRRDASGVGRQRVGVPRGAHHVARFVLGLRRRRSGRLLGYRFRRALGGSRRSSVGCASSARANARRRSSDAARFGHRRFVATRTPRGGATSRRGPLRARPRRRRHRRRKAAHRVRRTTMAGVRRDRHRGGNGSAKAPLSCSRRQSHCRPKPASFSTCAAASGRSLPRGYMPAMILNVVSSCTSSMRLSATVWRHSSCLIPGMRYDAV